VQATALTSDFFFTLWNGRPPDDM